MSARDNGGSAFPTHDADAGTDPRNQILTGGMTLRDWFAGQALAGELANEDMGDGPFMLRSNENAKLMAERAYHIADAMLAARSKGEA